MKNQFIKQFENIFKFIHSIPVLVVLLSEVTFVNSLPWGLLRIKSIEQIRYCDPGEFVRIVGKDRVPEVKTLRQKIKIQVIIKEKNGVKS